MTTPTLTYGHGFLEDFLTVTVSANWHYVAGAPDLNDAGIPHSATFTNSNRDYGVITAVNVHNGDSGSWSYYDEGGASNIGKSTHTYTKILVRYRTSVAATGLGLKVGVVFTGATTEADPPDQWIVGTLTTPAYSTDFTTASVTLTDTETLDHIRLYAVSEKGTNNETITIDFILVYRAIFQFPDLKGGFEQQFQNNYGRTKIAGRKGNNTSYLGCSDSPFHIYGDISYEDSLTYPAVTPSWRDGSADRAYLIYGQFMRQLIDEAHMEPWQWMTSNLANCKVTADGGTLRQIKTDDDILWFELYLYEFRQSSSSNESYIERWGLKSFI